MGLLGGGALTPVKIVLQSSYSEVYFSYAGVQYATAEDASGLYPPVSIDAFRGDDLNVGISSGGNRRGIILQNGVTVVAESAAPVSYSMTVPSDVLIVVSRVRSYTADKPYIYTARIITADATPLHAISISGGNTMGMNVTYNGASYVSGEILVPDGEAIKISTGYMANTIKLNGTTVASGQYASYELAVTADTTIAVSGFTIEVTTA